MRVKDKRIELLPPQLNARKIWLDGLFTRGRGSGGNVTSLPYKFFISYNEVDQLGV
jgi:hypothetical protein